MAEFSRHEEKLQTLEEKINPAANKSTQVFTFFLDNSQLKTIQVVTCETFWLCFCLFLLCIFVLINKFLRTSST